ncbi:MAG: 3-5 exonuclease [Anaeromyxobacteraceae bacterium]|nr:3-5 exonuclease [Anaeromyxobacteraceae bacterium]
MEKPQLIATERDLAELLAELSREPVLAIDTEAASFHRHHDRIYLIQVSSRERTAIIDPLALPDLSGFGALLADSGIEAVFHDADYDLRLFDHQYGFRAARIFDTRIAAEFLGEPGLSLAALLERHFGVRMDKRFQRADWSERPLSPEMLAYAAADTAHLVALRNLLGERLIAAGRSVWAEEEFAALTTVRWTPTEDREPGWLRLKGAKQLPPRQLAILREVHGWRVEVASTTDRAEFRILGNEALFAIADQAPRTVEELEKIKGIGRDTLQRRGRNIIAAVNRALALPESKLPRLERPPRRPREPEIEARLARLKAARTGLTARLGLDAGVAAPNSLLETVARAAPASLDELARLPGVRRWQVEALGKELLQVLRNP